MSTAEHHSITRPDGVKVDAWFMKPTNYDGASKYPLILEIHGGPSAMWGPSEASTWFEFQYFAGRGYGIVYSNPRGSGGYGYNFVHANFKDWGTGPSGDILAAVDLAAEQPWVDVTKEVVTGGSYGGYMTACGLSRTTTALGRRWRGCPAWGLRPGRHFSARATRGDWFQQHSAAIRGRRRQKRFLRPTLPLPMSTSAHQVPSFN